MVQGEKWQNPFCRVEFVLGWEQQPFVYPAGLRFSDISTVNSLHRVCVLAFVSVPRRGEVNARLFLVR